MVNKKTRNIAFDAIFLAIIIVLTFVPYVGFIPIGPVSLTTITIPVFIGAYIFDWKKGLLYGTFFGLASFIRSFMSYVTVVDPIFQNPLISVLPRALFGLVTGLVFDLTKKITNPKLRKGMLPVIIAFTSLIHSILVLLMMGIFHNELFASFLLIFGTNGVIEAIFAAIIVPLILLSLQSFIYKEHPELEKQEEEKVDRKLKVTKNV